MFAAKYQNKIFLIIKYLLAVLLLCFLWEKYKNEFNATLIQSIQLRFVFVVLSLRLLHFILSTLRWHFILRDLGGSVDLMRVFELSVVGQFFNYVTPGAVSGDLVKAHMLRDIFSKKVLIYFSILVDRLSGLFSLFIVLFLGMLFAPSDKKAVASQIIVDSELNRVAIIFVPFILCLIFIPLAYLIHKKINPFKYNYKDYPMFNLSMWIKAHSISLLIHFVSIISLYCAGLAVSSHTLSLAGISFVFPLASLLVAVPLTPGGLGIGQTAYTYLFNIYYNMSTNLGFIVFTVCQLLDILILSIGTLLALWKKHYIRKNV